MMIALALTFMTMYVINFLLMTTVESYKSIFLERPKKMVGFQLSVESMGIDISQYEDEDLLNEAISQRRKEIGKQLEQIVGIEKVYYAQMLNGKYQSIVGELYVGFPMLEANEIPEYMEHMGMKLIDGRLPSNDGEILVDQKMFLNQKMKIGDAFEPDIWGENFKVVGVSESNSVDCVGTPMGYTNAGRRFIVLCNESTSDMNENLKKIGIHVTEYDTLYDAEQGRQWYEDEVRYTIDTALLSILIVVMIFLAISILVSYISFLRNRINEYCLYISIGFGRGDIYRMMLREIGLIFGVSILLSVVVTILVMLGLGHWVLDPMGLIYRYLYPKQLLRIVAAFMAIVGALQLPIIITINNIKTIDRIEE